MCRHVDLLAIGCLLVGMAFVMHVRNSVRFEYQSVRLVNFTTRHLQQFATRPQIPQLCLSRD
jgi:hypothetical protein